MDANHQPFFVFAILMRSLTFYFAKFSTYLGILIIPAITIALVSIGLISLILGFSQFGSQVDPTTFQFTLSSSQWVIFAMGAFVAVIVLSLSMATTVYATAREGVGGVRGAFASLRSKPLQIFWLQCVIYALALRFSPWAALLFWLLVALAVPAALCENLGPNEAIDRAWSLGRGRRLRIFGLEILLLIPAVAAFVLIGVLARPNGPIYQLSPAIRTACSWVMAMMMLAPIQFMFVAITRTYQSLATQPGSSLHAPAGSDVNP